MATAGSIVIDLIMRTGMFETDSKRAEKRLKELGDAAYKVGLVIGGAMSTAAVTLAGLTFQAIKSADQLDELSQRLQISTEQLSKWEYAAKLSGSSLDGLSRGLGLLSRNLAASQQAGSRQEGLFKTLGVEAKDAEGNLRAVDDVLPDIADAFKALDNQTLETALAMELFGRSGAELLEFLNRGSEGITELGDELSDLGGVIDGETASAAAEFNDQLDKLKVQASALGLAVARDLLPRMVDITGQAIEFVKQGDRVRQVADQIASAFDAASRTVVATHSALSVLRAEMAQIETISQKFSPFSGIRSIVDGGSYIAPYEALVKRQAELAAESEKYQERFRRAVSGEALFGGSPAPASSQGIDFTRGAPVSESDLEQRLNAFLADPTGKGGKGRSQKPQKSEAEREAERLQQSYESLMATANERIALFGQEGEAARVRYETEHGALAALEPALKQQIIDAYERLDLMNEEAELARELAQEEQRRFQAFERVTSALRDETELVGMLADQQEVWNNLKWAGVAAESAMGQEIIASTEKLQRQRTEMDQQIEAMDAVRDAGQGLFNDLIDGVNPLEALESALDRIYDRITDMIAENLMDQLFGKRGDPAGGSMGGWINTALSWLGFGGGKAGGGDTLPNRAFLVGEQGPELFVPRTAGTVIPAAATAHAMSGGAGRSFQQNLHVTVAGRPDRRTPEQIARASGREASRAMSRTGR